MTARIIFCWLLAIALPLAGPARAVEADATEPEVEIYARIGDVPLTARILRPAEQTDAPRAAIVLFHGGGWNEGDASWMDGVAQRMTAAGLVAISVDYRLSDQKTVTPFDAVVDARAAMRWVRSNATRLGIDPKRVAAGGTSAGAHLAVATAIFDDPWGNAVSARPDALVLRSAAVSIAESTWFRKLTGGTAQAASLSPDLHIRPGLPPAIVLQGAEDNVTPVAGAQRFCDRMRQSGNRCDLQLYPGVGHLFTRNLQQQEIPDYDAIDPDIAADANARTVAFLRDIGFAQP